MLVGFSKQYYENAPNVSVSMDGEKAKHCNVHLFCNLCTNKKSGRTNIWEKITCVLACCHYSSSVIIVNIIVTNIINLIIKEFFAFITVWGEMVGNSHPVPLLMIIYWSDDSIQTVPEEVQPREMILWSHNLWSRTKCEMLFPQITTILFFCCSFWAQWFSVRGGAPFQ